MTTPVYRVNVELDDLQIIYKRLKIAPRAMKLRIETGEVWKPINFIRLKILKVKNCGGYMRCDVNPEDLYDLN